MLTLSVLSSGWDVLAVLVTFFACEVQALRRWERWWRALAAAPGIAVLYVIARIEVDCFIDPGSHWWPDVEVLWWSCFGLGVLSALWVVRSSGMPGRRRDGRRPNEPQEPTRSRAAEAAERRAVGQHGRLLSLLVASLLAGACAVAPSAPATEEDVERLEPAAMAGQHEAIRGLFELYTRSDGAVSEGIDQVLGTCARLAPQTFLEELQTF